MIKKGDVIIIGVACIVAAALLIIPLLFKNEDKVAIVIQDGRVTDEIDLSSVNESFELTIRGAKLLVEKDQIAYVQADCPDQICIGSGVMKNVGDMAACVPNKTCVYIKGKGKIDAVTY